MLRKLIFCFLGCFLLFPSIVLAETQLDSDRTMILLHSAFSGPVSDTFLATLFSNDVEKQAALMISKKAMQVKSMNYALIEMPTNLAIELFKKARLIASLYNANPEEIITQLEKESVKESKKIIEDWLTENQVKIASGYIDKYKFTSCKGNKQSPVFGYNVILKPMGDYYDALIEFYSPGSVEPPSSKGSSLVFFNYWNQEDWEALGKDNVPPFIIRIKGRVKEVLENQKWSGYNWSEQTLEVIFNEDVPEVVIPTLWDKTKQYVSDYIKSYIPDLSFLKGQASQTFSITNIDGVTISSPFDFLSIHPTCNIEPVKIEIAEIPDTQDILDDIMEKIDILAIEVKKFIGKDDTPEEDEDKEEEPKTLADKISEVYLCPQTEAVPLTNRVIINEVAWMGNAKSSSDEWIELKNISKDVVDISAWQVLDKNNDIKAIIPLNTKLTSNGLYLLERTDQNSVPTVLGDLVYTGGLSDIDETLSLFNANCELEDKVLTPWPAGNKESKRSMERGDDLNWHDYYGIGKDGIFGTPKQENSKPGETIEEDVLITEIQTAEDEFIELYNQSGKEIDLTGWYMQRKTKSGDYSTYAPSTLFSGKIIDKYLLISRKNSNIGGDILVDYPLTDDNTIVLKNSNKEIVDKVGWGEASDFESEPAENPKEGESLVRKFSNGKYIDTDNNKNDFEITSPTPYHQKPVWNGFFNKYNGRSDYSLENSGIDWSYQIAGEESSINYSNIVIDSNNEIYVAAGSKIYVFNSNGTRKLEIELSEPVNYLTLGPDKTLYASGSKIYAIKDTVKWEYSQTVSAVAVSNDNLIYFTSNTEVFCLNPDGTLRWRAPGLSRGGSSSYGPVLGKDYVYAVFPGFRNATDDQRGYIYAYDRLTGSVKWNNGLQFSAGPITIANNEDVYVMAGIPGYFGTTRYAYIFSKEGKLKWDIGTQYGDLSAPIISKTGNVVFVDNWSRVAGESWGLYVWQPMSQIRIADEEGNIIWNSGEIESSLISQPLIDDSGRIIFSKTLYKVYSKDIWSGWGYVEDKRVLQGIDSETGNELFSYDIPAFQTSFAISKDGKIVGISKNKIYSFGINNPFGIQAEKLTKNSDEFDEDLSFLDEDFSDYEIIFSDEIYEDEENIDFEITPKTEMKVEEIVEIEDKSEEIPVETQEAIVEAPVIEPTIEDTPSEVVGPIIPENPTPVEGEGSPALPPPPEVVE